MAEAVSKETPVAEIAPTAPIGSDLTAHDSIRCAQCGIYPIVGIRYKCTVREDFNLCASCESKDIPLHPMFKLYSPVAAISTHIAATTTTTVRCSLLLLFLSLNPLLFKPYVCEPFNRLPFLLHQWLVQYQTLSGHSLLPLPLPLEPVE